MTKEHLNTEAMTKEHYNTCSEAVLLHSIVNVYFLWKPVFTMLYPATNDFLSQFTKRYSWVLCIPLNRQRRFPLILRERHQPPQYLKKRKS